MSRIKTFQSLNNSEIFNKVYSKPTYCWHTKEFVLFYRQASVRRFAFVASKKISKSAVKRNRAKRVLKAHFITLSLQLKSGIYIFVAKEPILNSNFKKTNKTLKYICKKLNLFM